MRVLVAGGAGYVGSKLVPALLEEGYAVTVLDLYLFGHQVFESIRSHPNLKEIQGDIRDLRKVQQALAGCSHVIHLACISNDPSFELNPKLGKSINFDAFEPFVLLAKQSKIERFIFASSSSVYGIKKMPDVTEECTLQPLTDYSKYKAACENILLQYADDEFICTVLRPATVCGYAPRQRFDVVVNLLTNVAYHTRKVTLFGGAQMRANIHIDDMVDAYIHVLKQPKDKIQKQIFNVGSANFSVREIGEKVAKKVGKCTIEVVPTDDNRSYHISSEKIARLLGFVPRKTIEEAIQSLLDGHLAGKFPDSLEDKRYFNVKTMKALNLV